MRMKIIYIRMFKNRYRGDIERIHALAIRDDCSSRTLGLGEPLVRVQGDHSKVRRVNTKKGDFYILVLSKSL